MRLLGHVGGAFNAVHLADNRTYLGEGPRLTVLDVTDATTPTVLGKSKPMPNIVEDVMAVGNTVYVADGESGLFLFDVTNPAAPAQLGVYDTPGSAQSVFVTGTVAYVANGSSGLRVLNVANPAAPTELAFFDTPGTAEEVFVVGATAYVADGGSGLRILNVANPNAPAEIGFYDPSAPQHYAGCLFVSNNLAYICDGYSIGFSIINVADPSSATQIGFFPTPFESIRQIFVTGDTAYVAVGFTALVGGATGLKLVNVVNPASPALLGKFDITGRAAGVFVRDNQAYIADQYSGLLILNVADPSAPAKTGAYGAPGGAASVHLSGNTAYVANLDSGLRLIQVANAADPAEIGSLDTAGFAYGAFAVGNTAYVADGNSGLQLINVANPAAPTALGIYDSPGGAAAVFVANERAYIADLNEGLRIVNVANPANPVSLGVYTATGLAENVVVNGSTAYIAYGSAGLRVINVANPAAPTLTGSFDTPGEAWDVAVQGSYAYVADTSQGLRIINLNTMSEVGSFDTPGSAYGVFVVDTLAYVADGASGLRVINIANPALPSEVGFYDTPGSANDVYVAGNTIYVADGNGGLFLLRYPACYRLTLSHMGSGADPLATPANSTGCSTGEYLFGQSISVSANPAAAWQVAGWIGTTNDRTSAVNNVVLMPAADHEVTVNYTPVCYALTLAHMGTGADPTASPTNSPGCATGQYVAGQAITLNAAPGTGYTVGSWGGTTTDNSTALANTVTMPGTPHTASVAYVLACYSLTLTHSGAGSDPLAIPSQSSGCDANRYHFNEPISLSATPDTGWQIASWSGANNNVATTPTNSLTMPPGDHTASVIYSEIPTVGPGDAFEVDNSCTRHRPIVADGSETQEHTFHAPADEDWVRFTVAAGSTYRIEVQVPADSSADVNLEVYAQCEAAAFDNWQESFSPGARLDVTAPASGQVYVRLTNQDAAVAGAAVRYQLSVRALSGDTSNRALILLAGRLRGNDSLQKNIHNVTNAVYTLFQRNGYTDDNIQYLATDTSLAGFDAAATRENLRSAITQWAKTKVGSGGVLTLYLMDHGGVETFYIDELSNQRLSPSDLDGWLTELETAVPNLKINVILEACQSGSFVTLPQSISKANRVVIASTNDVNDAKASKDGAYFSDHLLTWLHQGYNLLVAFNEAKEVASTAFVLQQAMIDGNGNGIPNELTDGAIAASRSFAYAGTFSSDDWPPHIFTVQPPTLINNFKGVIQADVRDNQQVRQVWAVVYPPDYTPPVTGQELQPEVLPTFLLTPVDNGSLYAGEFTGFTQTGVYRIVVQAEDADGLVALAGRDRGQYGQSAFLALGQALIDPALPSHLTQ